jgi:ABC-2 type transport system permease protein
VIDVNPVLYDFKRAFIRPATIIALAVFILVGIGLSYLVTISLGMSAGAIYPMFIAKLDVETGEFTIYYVAYDSEANPTTAHVEVSILFGKPESLEVVKTFTFNAKGYHVFQASLDSDVLGLLSEKPLFLRVASSTPFGFMNMTTMFLPKNNKIMSAFFGDIFISNGEAVGSILAVGIAFLKNSELIITLLSELPSEGFELYYALSSGLGEAGFDEALLAGNVSTGLTVFRINASELGVNITDTTMVTLYLKDPEGVTYTSKPGLIIRVKTGVTQRRITNVAAGSAGIGLFSQFFPIVVLYLAYTLVAKPKGMGALEFLIARPVTRLEIYVTRFLAGVLTAPVSTGVFLIALNSSIFLLTGYSIEASNMLILFLGIAGSLIAFYSVCYMFSTILSGSRYLAVSIFLYLFFTMIMGILVFVTAYLMYGLTPRLSEELLKMQYTAYYFNPLGLTSFATYYVNKAISPEDFPDVPVVNPYLVVVAGVAWTLLPAVTGWILFRRANLSR